MALNNSEKQEVQRTRLGPGQIGTLLPLESLIPVNEGVAMTWRVLIPANQHANANEQKEI
ncbi:MAG: hypothetical protein VW959_05550 [Aquiluna sp.]